MNEHEISNAADASFFLANEVVNEYHSFPVVQGVNLLAPRSTFIQLNGKWFKFEASEVKALNTIIQLERQS